MISSSSSTGVTCRAIRGKTDMNDEKDVFVIAINGTYPWSFVAHILYTIAKRTTTKQIKDKQQTNKSLHNTTHYTEQHETEVDK